MSTTPERFDLEDDELQAIYDKAEDLVKHIRCEACLACDWLPTESVTTTDTVVRLDCDSCGETAIKVTVKA